MPYLCTTFGATKKGSDKRAAVEWRRGLRIGESGPRRKLKGRESRTEAKSRGEQKRSGGVKLKGSESETEAKKQRGAKVKRRRKVEGKQERNRSESGKAGRQPRHN